jgi:nitroreductase
VFAAPGVVEEYDYALAAENMMLAAHSLGIGSFFDTKKFSERLKEPRYKSYFSGLSLLYLAQR